MAHFQPADSGWLFSCPHFAELSADLMLMAGGRALPQVERAQEVPELNANLWAVERQFWLVSEEALMNPILLTIGWKQVFLPNVPILETILRGTLVYLSIMVLLRAVLKREAGTACGRGPCAC